jgi:hypothetical protein
MNKNKAQKSKSAAWSKFISIAVQAAAASLLLFLFFFFLIFRQDYQWEKVWEYRSLFLKGWLLTVVL